MATLKRDFKLSKDFWITANEVRSCPLCNHHDSRVVSRRMQYELDLTTVICEKCGLVFTNPVPTEEVYTRFYIEAYADYYGGITALAPTDNQAKEPKDVGILLNEIHELRPLHSTRLMEVGPGKGRFLYWAKQRGASVLGVEPSKAFFEVLRSSDLPALNTTLEDLSRGDVGAFDVIAMFHVLMAI